VEREGAFIDRVMSGSDMAVHDDRDRRFIRELVIGAERHRLRLDQIVRTCYNKPFESLDPLVLNILRLGLYQMIFMDSVPDWAAVNESVNLAASHRGRGAAGLVNAILRRFTREGEPKPSKDPAERLSVETSHPRWLVDRWIAVYGYDNAAHICRAGIEKHPVFIRARKGKTTTDELGARLAEEGFESVAVPHMEGYLSVLEGTGIFDSKSFNGGLFTVQDPSAGLAGELLAPEPEERILDLCAAPGGKATQCAEMMGDCGCVTAVDLNKGRLGLVDEAAKRLGVTSIRCMKADASEFGDDGEAFDRVLLDAPCTGTAVLAKRPDMKWRLGENDIVRLAGLQRRLLENAARLTAPGGVLVYSTCSLEPEENDDNTEWFLDAHPEFKPVREDRFAEYSRGNGYLILPHLMGGTGAFAVKMKRADE